MAESGRAGVPEGAASTVPAAACGTGDATEAADDRFVEVAVDAAGAGGQHAYTYRVPPRLADLAAGEAVLVGYGRRQALGVILADSPAPGGFTARPILERVRSDGPLLPPLSLALARWIAAEYLAPPAMVLRAMLPPGLLERLELVAEAAPEGSAAGETGSGAGALDAAGPEASAEPPASASAAFASAVPAAAGPQAPADAAILARLAEGPRAVRELDAPEGRAGLLRRLHALSQRGLVRLEWTLTVAAAGPRYERWLTATPEGTALVARLVAGERPAGRSLGPRQRSALQELVAAGTHGTPAAALADRNGDGAVAGIVRRGLASAEVRERPRLPLAERRPGRRGGRPPGTALSAEQVAAVARIEAAIAARDSRPFLLTGVTGAGKTAVYVAAIAASLAADRPALVLVPEIAQALPLVDRLRADLAARVALVHSGLGEGERADEWRRIRAGDADIVVGTRSAVLAPLAELGLLIVDEEHEAAYKSDRTPRLQARDTALRLAELAGAAAVLGSATPAVESVGRARRGVYRRLALSERPSGRPPAIELVDLRAELAVGNRGLLSARLAEALARLEGASGERAAGEGTAGERTAGERAILVINRRGSASVVLCRDCGHVQACAECGRPLVFHQAGNTLRCHHCGTAVPPASRCPACRSPRIRFLGGGTERVEAEVRARFPALRVGRLDRDVVERRGAAARVVDAFAGGGLDVLVGTSLVAKGLDIPEVTLVGIVSADVALNLPDERAAERTYQLLVQAVGRAGRGERPGLAIVQTYQPDHPAIRAVVDGTADAFYDAELELRRRFGSPPFGRLVKLTVALPERDAAERAAREMVERLRARAGERGARVEVTGPAAAYVPRRAGRWRWNVVLRGERPVELLDGGPAAPWSVDVDPESLL